MTNAILCNPRDDGGNNRAPDDAHLTNCRLLLRMTVDLIDPCVIVTLGSVALKALNLIMPHPYSLSSHVRQLVPWAGRLLMPLYHPGQRAMLHRSMIAQQGDFYHLAKHVHPAHGLHQRRKPTASHAPLAPGSADWRMAQAIYLVVSWLGAVSRFKLTKLLYLADLRAVELRGRSITQCVYLRQTDGPWPPKMAQALQKMAGHEVLTRYRHGTPAVCLGPSPRFEVDMQDEDASLIADVLQQYGSASDSRIKAMAYVTVPMREVIRRERAGESMLNEVILRDPK